MRYMRDWKPSEFFRWLVLIALLVLAVGWCCGCITDAAKRGYEQIHWDIQAGEVEDADGVALTAMAKYGRSKKHTDSTTTQDTIHDIQEDKIWSDYIAGGANWLWNQMGWDKAIMAALMAALGIYAKVKNSRLKTDNEQMVEAGMGNQRFEDKMAKSQAREMPLNKTVQKVKLKNGKGDV